MTKIGIGVGEEFPVDEPPPPPPPPTDEERNRRERHWRWHRRLHIATRVAFLALIVAAIFWMFGGNHYAATDAAGAVRPYPHHFFFPFFPIFLLLLFAFAWRRRGCYGGRSHWHHHHHHYHRHDGDPREET
jgi:hypothetical protein